MEICLLTCKHTCVQLGLASSIPEAVSEQIEALKARLSRLYGSQEDRKEELADKEHQLRALLQPYVRSRACIFFVEIFFLLIDKTKTAMSWIPARFIRTLTKLRGMPLVSRLAA